MVNRDTRVKGAPAARALAVALVAVFSPLHLRAQSRKQPDKYAITGQEEVFAQAACMSRKYGPGGPAAWFACQNEVIAGMSAAKKLRYLEGSWVLTGKLKASRWSKPGSFFRTERNAWQENDWSLVSHWTERQPAGVVSGTTTLEYDRKSKAYTFQEISPGRGKQAGTGRLDAATGTWTWLGRTRLADGKEARSRWTVHPVSDSAYAFQLAIALPNGKWTTVLIGKGQKSR